MLRPVVGVGADEQRTLLIVEGKVSDVDVARRPEDAARLPVQTAVVMKQNANALEVRNQLFRSAKRTIEQTDVEFLSCRQSMGNSGEYWPAKRQLCRVVSICCYSLAD